MSREAPSTIRFGDYTRVVPPNIPSAVGQATSRFLGGRAARVAELPQWQQLRDAASELRLHTLTHLDWYLAKLSRRVVDAGGHVHWAADAAQACSIVTELARAHAVTSAVKVKSMATEEIGLNQALQRAGIRVLETDLGEYIVQLAGASPSHIIVPAVHMTRHEIAELFRAKLGVDAPAEPAALAELARTVLRERFLLAGMGISGANFLVAETGTIVTVTNEGNGRMCTTLPDLYVAVVGIDKVVPDWESLTVLLKLLARSATGQKLSAYTSFITGPSRSSGEGGPRQLHLVLLDNGRSRMLADPVTRETLKCIRCGCCLNVCPVYQHVGGFAYGWFISGPIGAIFTPQILGTQAASELPFASSLCGACVEVCPVKVPITKILLRLRQRVVQNDALAQPSPPLGIRAAARLGSVALSSSVIYRLAALLTAAVEKTLDRDGWIEQLPPPLRRWTSVRPMPVMRTGFRRWWAAHQKESRSA